MRNLILLTVAGLVAMTVGTTQAALTNLTEITAIGTSGDTLTSISIGSKTYSDLISPTAFVNNLEIPPTTDWVYTPASTVPTDLKDAVGSLNLAKGTLNNDLEAQFGGALTDDSLIFILINNNDNTPGESGTLYALDAAGNRLNGGVGTNISYGADDVTLTTLLASRTYNRQTNGAAAGTLTRVLLGGAFTLNSLGLGGLGATGFELTTGTIDPQEIGIVAVPTPAALPAGLALMGAMLIRRRRSG